MTALFKDGHDALLFAFGFDRSQYGASSLALAGGPAIGNGKGLVGMDGSGQAGMILRHVEDIGNPHTGNPLLTAVIVAAYVPKYQGCPCCGNSRMLSDLYQAAVSKLAAAAEAWIPGTSKQDMREVLVRAHFEDKISIATEAARCNVAVSTAYLQRSYVIPKLAQLDIEANTALSDRLAKMTEAGDPGA